MVVGISYEGEARVRYDLRSARRALQGPSALRFMCISGRGSMVYIYLREKFGAEARMLRDMVVLGGMVLFNRF